MLRGAGSPLTSRLHPRAGERRRFYGAGLPPQRPGKSGTDQIWGRCCISKRAGGTVTSPALLLVCILACMGEYGRLEGHDGQNLERARKAGMRNAVSFTGSPVASAAFVTW